MKKIFILIAMFTLLNAKMEMITICEPGEGCRPVWITVPEGNNDD